MVFLSALGLFFKGLLGLSLVALLLGLYKPWWVLWWQATQNRKKVLLYYGTATFLTFLVQEVLHTIMGA